MGTKRLERLQFHLAAVSRSLADVTDAAVAAAPADSGAAAAAAGCAAARVAQLGPVLALIREANRRALGEYLRFHRSSAKLEAVLKQPRRGFVRRGFLRRGRGWRRRRGWRGWR